jgi:predicted patatin/cPLA2 family phospholipase
MFVRFNQETRKIRKLENQKTIFIIISTNNQIINMIDEHAPNTVGNQFSTLIRTNSAFSASQKSHSRIIRDLRTIPELIGHVRAKYEELKLYRPPITDMKEIKEREGMNRIYTFLMLST